MMQTFSYAFNYATRNTRGAIHARNKLYLYIRKMYEYTFSSCRGDDFECEGVQYNLLSY